MQGPDNWDWNRLRTHCQREARRLIADAQDAEDAVQEAMARAWHRRDRCRSPEAPLPWMLQITRNEAFRLLAKRRALIPINASEVDWPVDAGGAFDPDLLALRVDVRRALARLPSRDRALASLRYGEDLAQNRIAMLLDTPEGTIRVRLHRVRRKLRGELRESHEGDHQPQ